VAAAQWAALSPPQSPTPQTGLRETTARQLSPNGDIDTTGGPSYISHGAHSPVPPTSDPVRCPMLWVHRKVPHVGLSRV